MYRIKLGVDNSECQGYDEMVKWVTVDFCTIENTVEVCCIIDAVTSPNPTSSLTFLYYTITEQAYIGINLIGVSSPSTINLQSSTNSDVGNYCLPIATDGLANGIYTIQIIINNSDTYNINFVVQH